MSAIEQGNQATVLAIIKRLVGQANVLIIPRLFVDLTGSLEAALFLSQLLYWSDKGKRPDGFIYKSRREWREELALSDYAIRKAAEILQEKGLLEMKLHRAGSAPTLHYRVDQEALMEGIRRFVEINETDLLKSTNGLVENDKSMICRDQQNNNRDYQKQQQEGDGGFCSDCFDLLSHTGFDSATAEALAEIAHEVWDGDACRLTVLWEKDSRARKGLTNRLGFLRSKIEKGAIPTSAGRKDVDDPSRFLEEEYLEFIQH